MQLENEFDIAAAPDRVYSFLLDVNRVVTCMPGAELSEVVDPTTFKGKVRIKVGPITVSYNGTARITEGGAAKLLQKLAHTYLGAGVRFPPMDNPPPGFITRIRVDRISGVGPWAAQH